ncbi:MAG: radical SAM protein [Bacteroidales bacterium]|nr:radical SAM protein [Lentimicrobiaceae bacterium]MDD5694452.1 radical SAM protein [Bacteroidales bacterium]
MPYRKHYTIPIFIPHLGCPHQCVFCNQRKISGTIREPDARQVEDIIKRHLSTIPRENAHIEIGFFGGSFTGIDPDKQIEFLSLAHRQSAIGNLKGIRISTRPDYIDGERLQLLKDHGVTTIELGAQSMDDEVLRRSGRGHTVADTEKASALILQKGFGLGLQMMIGLPGDTPEKSLHTARRIVELGADNTRIYPTLVIKNTPLAEWYRKGDYRPLSLDEAIHWTMQICRIFDNAGVNIIRMGLHPSEGLASGEELIAGPYHPSFRELVETGLWKERFQNLSEVGSGKPITIHVAPDQYNVAIGYRAGNKRMLLDRFMSVKFIKDESLTGRDFYVDYPG